eukprot:gnl/TRDRNA2_/TRDRNA2_159218_c0_seq3.p1 gnl/TRDRNA2_/TRDRNA2_159218_c0~~gnl/TRDRNA2_/TRDRNA2_159218_c0_seq3.p1  ORF type:complete len:164 (-),score=6.54 gnl/TRDRNA2_/TRDRNA2_159218_c0_seq3:70-561(-)
MSTALMLIVALMAIGSVAAEHEKSICLGDNCDEGESSDEVSLLQVTSARTNGPTMNHSNSSKANVTNGNVTLSKQPIPVPPNPFPRKAPKCNTCKSLVGSAQADQNCQAAGLMSGLGCPDSITSTNGVNPQIPFSYSTVDLCCCADGQAPLLPRPCVAKAKGR